MREHDNEPVWGLPERPPAGEQVVWQGRPEWRTFARTALHARKLALYLGALWLWSAAAAWPFTADSLLPVARNLGLALAAIGLVAAYGWLTARSTVIRFGIALPVTINLPFNQVDGAGLRVNADGTGDLTVTLRPTQKVAYLLLWPHARPWRLAKAEPSLRAIPDAGRVAQLLSRALAASADQTAPAMQPAAVPALPGGGRAVAA